MRLLPCWATLGIYCCPLGNTGHIVAQGWGFCCLLLTICPLGYHCLLPLGVACMYNVDGPQPNTFHTACYLGAQPGACWAPSATPAKQVTSSGNTGRNVRVTHCVTHVTPSGNKQRKSGRNALQCMTCSSSSGGHVTSSGNIMWGNRWVGTWRDRLIKRQAVGT